jgi:hypothetical protein
LTLAHTDLSGVDEMNKVDQICIFHVWQRDVHLFGLVRVNVVYELPEQRADSNQHRSVGPNKAVACRDELDIAFLAEKMTRPIRLGFVVVGVCLLSIAKEEFELASQTLFWL